ncbi:MAG TPA: hypothetical protein VJN96_16345 [Vicinamibacterales bacterium]|nr:hypothetical protein [Vicinamibacterales bacterium]
MNWPLVLKLSLFGLAMAIATVFVIPSSLEPIFWLVIFIICAVVIARQATGGRNFLHGLMVGIVNSVWVTGAHVFFFDTYVANHQAEAQAMSSMPFAPRVMMAIIGPVIGVVSGVVLGFFAMIAGKVLRRR